MNFFKLSLTIILLIVTLGPVAVNAEPGDVLAEYEAPYNRPIGLAWDDEHGWMWGINHRDPPRLYAIDPVDGEVVIDVEAVNRLYGGFYLDGVLFWSGYNDNPNIIFRYDTEGNQLENLNSPINLGRTFLASDGEHLFTNFIDDGVIHVFNLDDLQEVTTIDFGEAVGDVQIRSFEWVTAHLDGQLWLNGNGHLYECFVDGDWNCELVQDFEAVDGDGVAIAHDGENLWRGVGIEQILYVIDDGVRESAGWLAYDPTEGEVEVEGQAEVIVTIDAAGLFEGDYEADMIFTTNEPDAEDVHVNVLMNITGAPVLTITWPEEFGFNPDDPDASIIDWNLAYVDVFTDVPYDVTVVLTNTGTADLEVDGIECEDIHFIPDDDQMVLSHDESADLIITFVTGPDDPGAFVSVMTFFSNDPVNPEIEVALRCEALQPPEVRIEPLAIEDQLFTGQSEEYTITVFNDGQAPLRFTITHEIISEPLGIGGNRNVQTTRPVRRIDAKDNGNRRPF
ncbi:hypothetical protein ES703_21462 [subsurface metagenome]